MDFIQIIFGRYLLELLGALIRYTYLNIISLFNSSNYTPFLKIWSPKRHIDKKNENSISNHMIGVVFLGVVVVLLMIFMV